MSYQKERDEFIMIMTQQGMPLEIVELILRDATTIQRLAAEAHNRELTKAEEKRDEQAQTRIRNRCKRYGLNGFTPVFSGDPRGACVKLKVPNGYTNDWGREGVCVPTRRF